MVSEHRARLDGSGRRVAIVAGRFNDFVTRRLVQGAVECLVGLGVDEKAIDIYWVAGAFELPQMAARLSREGKADGIVTVGALIRGETIHYEVLCTSVADAVERVGTEGPVPVSFGVITADDMDQAIARAGGKHGNVGWNAALTLVEMMSHWVGQK